MKKECRYIGKSVDDFPRLPLVFNDIYYYKIVDDKDDHDYYIYLNDETKHIFATLALETFDLLFEYKQLERKNKLNGISKVLGKG